MNVSRELQHKIVSSLARGRSTHMTASRLRVREDLVIEVGRLFGWPNLGRLAEAADILRRPVVRRPADTTPPVPHPAPPEETPMNDQPPTPTRRALTGAERAACRWWATANGLPVKAQGNIAGDIVDAWNSAGRPTPPADTPADATPTPDNIPDTATADEVSTPKGPALVFAGDPQPDALDDLLDGTVDAGVSPTLSPADSEDATVTPSPVAAPTVAPGMVDVSGDPTAGLDDALIALLDEVRGHRLAALHTWINGLDRLAAHARRVVAALEAQ